jgi:serine/threonine protein kinase
MRWFEKGIKQWSLTESMKFRSPTFGLLSTVSLLGKGGEASVWRVEAPGRKKSFAVKKYLPHRSGVSPEKESRVAGRIGSHPNISLAIEKVTPKRGSDRCLLFKHYNSGDLVCFSETGSMEERETALIQHGWGLWDGLAQCHANDIMHRDIKPENILWHRPQTNTSLECESEEVFALSDFGCSSELRKTASRYPSQSCCPPEAHWSSHEGILYDESCDIWSLGVTWFSALVGGDLLAGAGGAPRGRFMEDGHRFIRDHHTYYWNKLSTTTKDLLEASLVPSPADRATSREVADLLSRHPGTTF